MYVSTIIKADIARSEGQIIEAGSGRYWNLQAGRIETADQAMRHATFERAKAIGSIVSTVKGWFV